MTCYQLHPDTSARSDCGERAAPRQEFHIRRSIREDLGLQTALFSLSGSAVFADLASARRFARDFETRRVASGNPDPYVRAGDIVAMGVLDEVLHHLLAVLRDETGEHAPTEMLARIEHEVGAERVESTFRAFCEEYPPAAVHSGEQSVDDYLDARVEGLSGRERTMEEIVLLRLTNENQACTRYRELFDESTLDERSAYEDVFDSIERAFGSVPAADPIGGGDRVSVLDLLRGPARAHPHSLEDQLAYARDHWGAYVGRFISRILRSMDVLNEEAKVGADPDAGPPPAEVYSYDDSEAERFSPDTEWMPGVVMVAKSTLVWLHQLSERYGRSISRLDEVPDEELDRLAASGFSALWLIGLWERSPASRRIKHLSGNPDAEASAYALYSYDIAEELGGWSALETLRARCRDRGVRLASDMVPNHTGIDSPWVHAHPDWYVHVDEAPFPSYSFTGENLAGENGAAVYLEDHYFDRTDAAVVFKHVDSTGTERFIYHGNDGTSMPWNDTAQLNYLNPEVRETVIQTILHVARNFPVIRFDAAMTLAKRHYRRLWFPEPGAGGDIASRSEHGLTRNEFDDAMPQEFWREVVERVAREAPGTLLLAEAFWMMEGYFVRSLGMHRVYNSAFMNMLKREQNAEYRQIIRDTLGFDPEILKRFVNFMNNPDEETAITQFGTGDKYFGVCTLLATLPGLPMFGHGQIEGLAEKYGMEFRRPCWDEHPDPGLIERHEREIFPLIRRRQAFASAREFRLYDLRADDGGVNENVFAYTNAHDGDRVLVAYNNSFEHAAGAIRESTPVASPDGERRTTVDVALGLSGDDSGFLAYQEQRSGLWHLVRSTRVKHEGLRFSLNGYEASILWNVHERVDDGSGRLAELERKLAGTGVPDIDRALAGLEVEPVREAYRAFAAEALFAELDEAMQGHRPLSEERFSRVRLDYRAVLERAAELATADASVSRGLSALERHLSTVVSLPHHSGDRNESTLFRQAIGHYSTGIRGSVDRRRLIAEWTLLVPLVEVTGPDTALDWGVESWADDSARSRILRVLLRRIDWPRSISGTPDLIRDLLTGSDALQLIGFHTHSGVEYYHQETMSELLWCLFAVAMIRLMSTSTLGGRSVRDQVEAAFRITTEAETANTAAQGRADRLMSAGSARAPSQEPSTAKAKGRSTNRPRSARRR